MTQTLTKISLILGLTSLFVSCNAVKHLEANEKLLTKNTITVDGEEIKDDRVYSLLKQKPNPKIPLIGITAGLHMYNLADQEPDSTFQKWLHKKPKREKRLIRFLSEKQVKQMGKSYVGFNRWLQKSGDAPVIIDSVKTNASIALLKKYYSSFGWLNAEATSKVNVDSSREKRASISYEVTRYKPYMVDSIRTEITSPVVDSLYQLTKKQSFIKSGNQFANNDFENERDRLTIQMRNSGLYYFDQDYVGFDADTVKTNHKANITYIITDRKITDPDGNTTTEPFKVHTIDEVRIVTDYTFANSGKTIKDSANFEGYKLYSYGDLKYRPKAITDAISISPDSIFRDIDRTLTYNQLNNLRIFKYPSISYSENPADTTGTGLIATILLSPRKKYTTRVDFDAYTSTIQQFGVGFSSTFLIRNVFKGAETLEISGRGSLGSSKDAADSESNFFNISDVGGDVKLSFPRFLLPFNTDKIIPKYTSPRTSISLGFSAQNNIGLDRQTINNIMSYRWKPSNIRTNTIELVNIQYVRNLNVNNYFRVYKSSYEQLNDIAQNVNFPFENPDAEVLELGIPVETNSFISQAIQSGNPLNLSEDQIQEVQSIDERQDRLSENNLIFASTFNWVKDTRENIKDNSFSRVRFKVESAGNLLSAISGIANLEKDENDNNKIFGVVFSQYVKLESDYIKHWELSNNTIFAIRAFGGIAIPYGNSNSIPFTRSYFAGGANDNRGWRAYDLGPGSSGGVLDFNEANLKLAFNSEYRYTLFGDLKGAFFIDAGNIWNVLDNVTDEASTFEGISDLENIAIASGLGARYDFGFFVLRLDVGFKTYDPSLPRGGRWFKQYNFANAVYNIGINYPF